MRTAGRVRSVERENRALLCEGIEEQNLLDQRKAVRLHPGVLVCKQLQIAVEYFPLSHLWCFLMQ